MPPLREALSRNFTRNASGILTQAGHGRLLIIGDSSLDVPDNAQEFYYLGNNRGDISAAAALIEIAKACPIDNDVAVRFMEKDQDDEDERRAPIRNEKTIKELGFQAIGLVKDGEDGFYQFSNGTEPTKAPIYCLTGSYFAYDCIAATIGHSQV